MPYGIANFQPDAAQRKFLFTQCGHTTEPEVTESCLICRIYHGQHLIDWSKYHL
ncbi:hypothetical protein [uncultured Tolumonas sp.]|uniref:hypothetical protein n=1 Tax=uncultured Tolumonas sp. TaxID=263765 RepID=UPI002A0A46BC|nr:hypothetical protein [uncultured Tolumonas sp.]